MRCEETRHGHTYTYLTSAQVSELRGVWRHIHSIKRPVWTGARGHSRETWEAWRIAIAGYAGGKRPYPLLRQEYATPDVPTASTTADQRRAYETHEHNTVLVVPPGTSYEGVSSSHRRRMWARQQPRRQGSLAGAGTHEWRTCTGRAACATTCTGTKTSRSPVQLCRRIGRFYGEAVHHRGGI